MNESVLVTGGAGFIGSHVVDSLVSREFNVVALDDLSGGYATNVNARATFVEGSILDVDLIDRLFSQYRFQRVYHLAAYAAEGLSHFIRRFNYTNNVVGSINLINASVNSDVDCFVFTSSIAVYGANQVPMSEDLTPNPEDPYGVAKRAVELDLMAAKEMFGLDHVIFRPHNVYGERQNIGDRYRNVVGIFMRQAMMNEPFTIFGDGNQTRAFTHVADIADIIARSPDVEGARNQVFNVGADETLTVNDLGRTVSTAMGVEFNPEYLPARKEVVHAYADHSRSDNVFDCQTKISIEEGIPRMADWAKEIGPRRSPSFSGIEILQNLPPSWRDELQL